MSEKNYRVLVTGDQTFSVVMDLLEGQLTHQVFDVETDAPLNVLTIEEKDFIADKAIELNHSLNEYLTKEITEDSYIQIDKDDTIRIVDDVNRFSLIFSNGVFRNRTPLFYLAWVPQGMLLEISKSIEHMARFTYRK